MRTSLFIISLFLTTCDISVFADIAENNLSPHNSQTNNNTLNITVKKIIDKNVTNKNCNTDISPSNNRIQSNEYSTTNIKSTDNTQKKLIHPFDGKIAVVDVESILEHSIAIHKIKKQINNISSQIQSELSKKEVLLKKIESELITQRGILSKEKFKQKIIEFNQQVSDTQKEMQRKKNALEKAHSEAITEVHKNTIDVISELSKKHKFNIVLPSTQVLFAANQLNITLEVISHLNDLLQDVKINYSIESK